MAKQGSMDGVLPAGNIRASSESPRRMSGGRGRRRSATKGETKLPSLVDDDDDAERHSDPCRSESRFVSIRSQQTQSNTISRQLMRAQIFKECSTNFLEGLAYHMEEKLFPPEAEIITQGEIGECMYLLNLGKVSVSVFGNKVAELESGTIFGEMAVLVNHVSAQKRSATITAMGTCLCWVISRAMLLKVLAAFPKDTEVLLAESNRRRNDLIAKGLIEEKGPERKYSVIERRSSGTMNNVEKAKVSLKTKLTAIKALSKGGGGLGVSLREKLKERQESNGERTSPDSSAGGLSSERDISKTQEELDRAMQYALLVNSIPNVILPNFTVKADGKMVPIDKRSLPAAKQKRQRRKFWALGETEEVTKARDSAADFLARRGKLFN